MLRSERSVTSIARRQRDRGDLRLVAVEAVRVDQRGEQVVRGRDRVHVAGEVEVDVLHRHHLRIAAAGGAALDAEHGAERRLPQRQHRACGRSSRTPASATTEVVVFPSPGGVGVIAVTLTSFASGRPASRSRIERSTFAL